MITKHSPSLRRMSEKMDLDPSFFVILPQALVIPLIEGDIYDTTYQTTILRSTG